MDAPAQKKDFAWQPLTPEGISKFARASLGRLWVVQVVFALLVASSVIWFLQTSWFPVIAKTAHNFPEKAEVRGRKLVWTGESPVVLAENRFLAVSVDLKHSGKARSPAHVTIEVGETNIKIFSLLGYVEWNYPAGWIISLARSEAVPWFGAWSPAILAVAAGFVAGTLLFLWTILATIYFGPAWLIAFFANRQLAAGGSWRLAGAAQMPGALWLFGVVLAYGFGWFDLIGLAIGAGLHFVIGWVYLVLGLLKIPLHAEGQALKQNPFAEPSDGQPNP